MPFKRIKEIYDLILDDAPEKQIIAKLSDILELPLELATGETVNRTATTTFPIYADNDSSHYIVAKTTALTDPQTMAIESTASLLGRKIALNIGRSKDADRSEQIKVSIATSSLSMAELVAVKYLLDELGGKEGVIVASEIADKLGVSRSSVASALEKLCAAQVMQKFSLGRKGTFIRVTNPQLIDEISKIAPKKLN